MIDHEYDHAVESIESKIYVTFSLSRSPTGTNKKSLNAHVSALNQNVSAATH